MPRDPRFHGSTTAAGSPGRSSRYGAAGPGRGARPGTSAGRFASDAQRTLCEPDKRADAAVRPCTDRVFESRNREFGDECGLKVRLNSKTAWAFLVPLVLLLSAGPAVRLSADASVRYIEVTAPRDWLLSGSTLQLEARAQRQYGAAVSNAGLQWRSANPSVAEVDSAGRVRGLTPGRCEIEASLSGASSRPLPFWPADGARRRSQKRHNK